MTTTSTGPGQTETAGFTNLEASPPADPSPMSCCSTSAINGSGSPLAHGCTGDKGEVSRWLPESLVRRDLDSPGNRADDRVVLLDRLDVNGQAEQRL